MKCRAGYFNNGALKRSRTWNIFIKYFEKGFKAGWRAMAWTGLPPTLYQLIFDPKTLKSDSN